MWNLKRTLKQGIGFALVGAGGVVVNGTVYAGLSQLEIFRGTPLNWWIFKEITWAWGIGILVAFVFNFVLNKWLVFKS
jgi:putative flippase GtrA